MTKPTPPEIKQARTDAANRRDEMKNLSERLNMVTGDDSRGQASAIHPNPTDLIWVLCEKNGIEPNLDTDEFIASVNILSDFCEGLTEDTGFKVTVWLDD